MWFHFDWLKQRTSLARRGTRRRPVHARLQLEVLEDRAQPSVSGLSGTLGDFAPTIADSQSIVGSEGNPVIGLEGNGSMVSAFAAGAQGVRVLWGESTIVDGSRIATWALVSPQDNTILAVGATFSMKMVEDMPESGDGPRGAFASLDFPTSVQETTFFNHLEIHPEPNGHPITPLAADPNRFRAPHFDFHFFGIPEEQVWQIPTQEPPLPPVPANLLAPGYTQAFRSEGEMGRHSLPVSDLTATESEPWTGTMIAGYLTDGSQMHFIEPMITQGLLLQRQDFTLPMPIPQELGRAAPTLYPTSFHALFQGDGYSFVFSDFVTKPATADLAATADSSVSPVLTLTESSESPLSGADTPATGIVLTALDGFMPAAFTGLDNAAEQLLPTNTVQTAPVFAINYGDFADGANASDDLNAALSQWYSNDPHPTVSPIFFALADDLSADDLLS